MAGFVGIDIGKTHVRAASLSVGYKRLSLARLEEVALDSATSLESALQQAFAPLVEHADGLAVAIDGDQCFIHRISIPATAQKRLEEVLPFEVEANVPVDIDELVFDHRPLRQHPRGFHVLRIIHQLQSLQRCVCALAADGANLAGRSVEGGHSRRRALSFPIGVHAAAI